MLDLQENFVFHVQSDNHMRINNSDNRKHMFDLTTQTNNSTLQAGLLAIKIKLNALSVQRDLSLVCSQRPCGGRVLKQFGLLVTSGLFLAAIAILNYLVEPYLINSPHRP